MDYGDLDSARSTSGFAMFIGSSLVSWASRRQPVVAKSTTEAEYIANDAGSEAVWFHSFLEELGYPQTSATPLHIDNQSAIKVGKNPEHHSQMKHLNTKYHWLRCRREILRIHELMKLRIFDIETNRNQ